MLLVSIVLVLVLTYRVSCDMQLLIELSDLLVLLVNSGLQLHQCHVGLSWVRLLLVAESLVVICGVAAICQQF